MRVELTDTFHVEQAYNVELAKKHDDAKLSLSKCYDDAVKQTEKVEGELFLCGLSQDEDLSAPGRRLVIYEWVSGEMREVEKMNCPSCYWKKDKGKKAAFVVRQNQGYSHSEAKKVDAWISVVQRPFDRENTLFVTGDCSDFYAWDPQFETGQKIEFTLVTDCDVLRINHRTINIEGKEKSTKISERYVLTLDDQGLPRRLISKGKS